jgi:competence ComEA-like helix-hairpin-helix protein
MTDLPCQPPPPARSEHGSAPVPGLRFVSTLLALALLATSWQWASSRIDPPGARAATLDMRIDVNLAPTHELQLLPGIGPALAQRIVEDRRGNGRYPTLRDLQRVPGIGPTTVRRLRTFAIASRPAPNVPIHASRLRSAADE